MAFLNGLDEIRNVNWGRKYTWDIKFNDPKGLLPTPFDTWFPASDIEIPEAILDSYTVDFYNQAFEIPMSTGLKELRVTFYDDSKFSLFKWIRNWINIEILNLNQASPWVSTLEESVKSVQLLKLDETKKPIETKSYLVYPKTTLSWEGTSAPESQQYQVSFIVAGESSVTNR